MAVNVNVEDVASLPYVKELLVWVSWVNEGDSNALHYLFELLLIGLLLYVLFHSSYKPQQRSDKPLTEKEITQLCDEWVPEPLVPDDDDDNGVDKKRVLDRVYNNVPICEGTPSREMIVNGKKCVNFVTEDYLGFASNDQVKQVSVDALRRYGCGTCGPRGFYGSIDVHLHLEKELASFMKTASAIIYTSQFSTMESIIPSFVKKGDVVVADEACSFALHTGIDLSKAHVIYYKHNDMKDLERALQIGQKAHKTKAIPRRYIVTEGLFYNTGNIVNLPEIVELKKKYYFRLLLDESYSIAVLGKTGRGVSEYFGYQSSDIDIICGSLSNSLSGVGGFCVSSAVVVDHQQLSSSGYCFSASLPPLITVAALESLKLLQRDPSVLQQLANNCTYAHSRLSSIKGLTVSGNELSPNKHIRLSTENKDDKDDKEEREEDVFLWYDVSNKLINDFNVSIGVAHYVEQDTHAPPRSWRVCISAVHTTKDIDKLATSLEKALKEIRR